MDPDANLAEQRRILYLLRTNGYRTPTHREQAVDRLLDLVEALDGWLMKGGFPPKDWREAWPKQV